MVLSDTHRDAKVSISPNCLVGRPRPSYGLT